MWIASVNVELSFRRAKFYRPRMLRILVIIKEEEENRKCMIKLFFVVYCRVPENRRIIFFSDVHCFPGKRENIYQEYSCCYFWKKKGERKAAGVVFEGKWPHYCLFFLFVVVCDLVSWKTDQLR